MTLIGLGGFPLQYITLELAPSSDLVSVPSMSDFQNMSKKQISDKLDEFDSLDAVVWRLSGEDPNIFIWRLRLLGMLKRFQNRSFKAAFWTMDTHHMLSREIPAAKYFDHVFIAHSPYLKHFRNRTASFLPCSVSIESKSTILSEISQHQGQAALGSGVALFANYPGLKRNYEYSQISDNLEDQYVRYFMGEARGGNKPNSELIRKTLEHRVVINLSIADDLNMRNFEALALNRVLLTNTVPDLRILSDWEQNIVVFKRDLTDFRAKLQTALEKSPDNLSASFLEKHHITNRVLKIIDTLFPGSEIVVNSGTARHVQYPIGQPSAPLVHEYEYLELLSSGGIYALNFRTIRRALKRFGFGQSSVYILKALRAALFRITLNSIGKASWLRALITLLAPNLPNISKDINLEGN
jgi:hypothetical protein